MSGIPDPLVSVQRKDEPDRLTKANLMRQLREIARKHGVRNERGFAKLAHKRIVKEYERRRRARRGAFMPISEFYAISDQIITSMLRREAVER